MNNPDIYAYDDFRHFLKDCYDARCEATPKYSFRKFASDAKISNPGYLNDVIKGRRTLSKTTLPKMIDVFELKPKEAEYFTILVKYGQSKKEEERDSYYQQILFRRARSSFTRLNPQLVRYYQDYRYPLVRAAIEATQFKGDYDALSKYIHPPIATSQVKKLVRDLCEWNLVSQDNKGHYHVTDKFIEPPETLLHLVRQLNREWIKHSYEAVNRVDPANRHISTILLSISRDTRETIKNKLEAFRQEIFDLISKDEHPETLMQLSLQFFPKSRNED